MIDELVVIELICERCACISPSCVQLSMCHSLSAPVRSPLMRQLPPGMNARPFTQSLCAFVIVCVCVRVNSGYT